MHSCVRRAIAHRLLAAVIVVPALLVLTLLPIRAHAQTYKMLYSFPGGAGGYAPSDVIVAPNGTIYGAAAYNPGCECDLIFSFANNKLTVLHSWSEPPQHNAATPQGLLLNSDASVLYGTNQYGGPTNLNCFPYAGDACGAVFAYRLATNVYHEFAFAGTPDALDPVGIQVLSSGYLFGVTWGGGVNGVGSFYRVSLTGAEQVLYSFANSLDGLGPASGLVAYKGAFYGVTVGGGNIQCPDGCGTIFKLTPTGSESVLYSFTDGSDGRYPYEIIGDGQGNFYGLSRNSGNVVVAVFEINASGQFSIAYNGSFASQIQSIILGPNGSLYGTASGGNSSCDPSGCGQVFQLTPAGSGNGTVNVLHQFDGTDGALPQIGSLALHNGVLVGSTAIGGTANQGVIYAVKP